MCRRIFSSLCVVLVFLFASSHILHAEEITKPFDYRKTIWIIHVAGDSGIVYGRPNSEDYNVRQDFIALYNIVIKYVAHMQDFNSSAFNPASESLQSTHQLILMNGETEQRLILGNHWISDEKAWASMEESDYQYLSSLLKHREALGADKKNPALALLIKSFRKRTSTDIEDFDSYFNLEKSQQSSSAPLSSRQSKNIDDAKSDSSESDSSEKSNPAASGAVSKIDTSHISKEVSDQLIRSANSVQHDLDTSAQKKLQSKHADNNPVIQQKEESVSWVTRLMLIISTIAIFGLWFKFRR